MKDGKAVYDKNTDVNTTGLYNRSTVKGLISAIPEVLGLIVYKQGHVGIYEGNGNVIEAKGFAHGVIRSKLTDTPWTHWIACPFLSYAGYEALLRPEVIAAPYDAVVVTKNSPLNIWNNPKKEKPLLSVPKGGTVRVLGYADEPGWLKVEKNGVSGVADGQYLQGSHESPAMETPDDPGDKEDERANELPDDTQSMTVILQLCRMIGAGNHFLALFLLHPPATRQE